MQDLKNRIERIQKDFSYTQIASLNKDANIGFKNINAEIWHCGKNGSSSYAFDICIMPFGIAVCGDIGELTFDVYGRNIDFLAGNDVGYYIHSKLSYNCKLEQFDEKKFYYEVADWIFSDFEDKNFISDNTYKEFEELIQKRNFADFFEKCKRIYFDCDVTNDEHNYLNRLYDFIEELENVEDERTGHELLFNTDFLPFDNFYEFNFHKIDEGLLFKLHMINYAAKKILELKS